MKKGTKSEKIAAKTFDGRRRPNSGATWHSKGDIITDKAVLSYKGMLLENKATSKKSYSLKVETLNTLLKQALTEDRMPVMRVEFDKENKIYIIIPEWVFRELLENNEFTNNKACFCAPKRLLDVST